MRCQRYLEGLVGEEQCRGVHVVLARESWFDPEQFRSEEPSTAVVADVEKQLTEQPLHVLVERMCVVGNSWPLCLARAAAKAHEAQRLLPKGALREKKKKTEEAGKKTRAREGGRGKKAG